MAEAREHALPTALAPRIQAFENLREEFIGPCVAARDYVLNVCLRLTMPARAQMLDQARALGPPGGQRHQSVFADPDKRPA